MPEAGIPIHSNLYELTSKLYGKQVDSNDVSDHLTGIQALATNEGEAAVADVVSTISFTTWIKDVIDGYKQERDLDEGTPEYDAMSQRVKTSIDKINKLGRKKGIDKDIIPMPTTNKELSNIGYAVYTNFALPYEANADCDYAGFNNFMAMDNDLAKATSDFNNALAENAQKGIHAKKYWNALKDANIDFSALQGEYLDSMAEIDAYEHIIKNAASFLNKHEGLSDEGKGDNNMASGDLGENGLSLAGFTDEADSMDIEGDNGQLQAQLRSYITQAMHIIKVERGMLQAGHIDSRRRSSFNKIMTGLMYQIMQQKNIIKADSIFDIQETKAIKDRLDNNPEALTEEEVSAYDTMVRKQMQAGPKSLGDVANTVRMCGSTVALLNGCLAAVGAAPLTYGSAAMLAARVGKYFYDANKYMEDKQNQYQHVDKSSAGYKAAVFNKSIAFSDNLRDMVRNNMISNGEDDDANDHLVKSFDGLMKKICDSTADNPEAIKGELTKLEEMSGALGEKLFTKKVSQMTAKELMEWKDAVKNAMKPMEDKQGGFINNFIDVFQAGEEKMDAHHNAMSNAIMLAAVEGDMGRAIEMRNNALELNHLSSEYNECENENEFDVYSDSADKQTEILSKADDVYNRQAELLEAYRPLAKRLMIPATFGLLASWSAKDAKHHAEFMEQVGALCKGTSEAIDKSRQEGAQKAQEFFGNLLRG